jgi:hypothetical protein
MPCGNVIVVMPINIACPGHVAPCNRRMASFHRFGQAPRGFGNDLETPRDSIDGPHITPEARVVETGGKFGGQVDVMKHVAKRGNRVI